MCDCEAQISLPPSIVVTNISDFGGGMVLPSFLPRLHRPSARIRPVNSNLGSESSLPVYVPLLPPLSASRTAWLVRTQQSQEMGSLKINLSSQACFECHPRLPPSASPSLPSCHEDCPLKFLPRLGTWNGDLENFAEKWKEGDRGGR